MVTGKSRIGCRRQRDVSFGEDAARNRKDNGPANIAVIRRLALDVARSSIRASDR